MGGGWRAAAGWTSASIADCSNEPDTSRAILESLAPNADPALIEAFIALAEGGADDLGRLDARKSGEPAGR